MRISTFILASTLLAQGTMAMDELPTTLDKLFEHVNALPNAKGVPGILERLQSHNPEALKHLCHEIMATNFYDKAAAASVGTLKRNAMVSFCSGTVFERADLKKATQKVKPVEEKKEAVKLKPIDFTKKSKSVEEEQQALKAVELQILENAEKLGKKQEFEKKLEKAMENLKKAKEFYDNLAVAIMGMRKDLKEIGGFKVFKPHNHDHDSPEQYLEALEASLPKENPSVLTHGSREQLQMASNLLKEANKNHASARHEMEAINREMMEIAHQ
jgi:hypothetical protein